jgi:hypothetical protein
MRCTAHEQLSKCVVEFRFLNVGIEGYRKETGKDQDVLCSDGLEL